jgi:hypothetical protein
MIAFFSIDSTRHSSSIFKELFHFCAYIAHLLKKSFSLTITLYSSFTIYFFFCGSDVILINQNSSHSGVSSKLMVPSNGAIIAGCLGALTSNSCLILSIPLISDPGTPATHHVCLLSKIS